MTRLKRKKRGCMRTEEEGKLREDSRRKKRAALGEREEELCIQS